MNNKLKAIARRNKRIGFKDLLVVGALLGGIGLSGYSIAHAEGLSARTPTTERAASASASADAGHTLLAANDCPL